MKGKGSKPNRAPALSDALSRGAVWGPTKRDRGREEANYRFVQIHNPVLFRVRTCGTKRGSRLGAPLCACITSN
jgi:hypothetical protein